MEAEAKRHKFTLSDESVNSYGGRVITEGIDLIKFRKNPVALWMHRRYSNDDLPIGKWENLKVEDGKLVGELVFDQEDEFAQRLESKVEQGILSAVSIGFRITKLSEDKADVVKGQTMMTITGSELMEVSLVDIPSNGNAVKLYDADGEVVELNACAELPNYMKLWAEEKPNDKNMDIVKLCALMGLKSDASEQEVVDCIGKLMQLKSDNESLKSKLQENEAELKKHAEDKVDVLLGQFKNVVTDDNREQFRQLALVNYDSVKQVLSSQSELLKLNSQPMSNGLASGAQAQGTNLNARDFDWYWKNDPQTLGQLKANDFDGEYTRLYSAKYGTNPKK